MYTTSAGTRYLILAELSLLVWFGCRHSVEEPPEPRKETFGRRQLEQMLDDRPEMRAAVPSTHAVVAWLIDSFEGKRLGKRIYWNANSPQSGRPAENGPSYGPYPPYIAISGGTEITPIDKWAAVVFEIFNLENTDDFHELDRMSAMGLLDADDYATQCVRLEFKALLKTHQFFQGNPLPTSKHGRDKWYNWVLSDLGTFEDYQTAFDVPGMNSFNSNFEYYKEYYNKMIVPYAKSFQQHLER